MLWRLHSLFSRIVYKHDHRKGKMSRLRRVAINIRRNYSHNKPSIILGIETSCDDTGCGIVDSNKNILSNERSTQHYTHLSFGGIIPAIATKMHRHSITTLCENALRNANLRVRDLDAIAVTVKPGLQYPLKIGMEFGKYLARVGNKPFIPIHHMQAHALTARLSEQVDFPYLALLISGGHCMLTIVKDVDTFYILGTATTNAPGELFDKVARRLKLKNIPEFSTLQGGRAIEMAARKAKHIDKTMFGPSMTHYRDCMFSFAGLTSTCLQLITSLEGKHGTIADMVIPEVYDVCAGYQHAAVLHVCQRTQRAIEYISRESLLPAEKRTLVVSGGVACNDYLANALSTVCSKKGYKFVRTPPELCCDNGIMIAWNGMERWLANKGVLTDQREIEKIQEQHLAPIGEDWTDRVANAQIKCDWVKI